MHLFTDLFTNDLIDLLIYQESQRLLQVPPLSVEPISPLYLQPPRVSELPESAVRLGVSSGAGTPCNDVS